MRLTPALLLAQQFVGPILDPTGDVGVGRAAVGRVVLEAAVFGRIVRRRDDDAVGQVLGAAAVVDEDRLRDDGRRRDAVVALDDRLDAVGGEHFERRALRRAGEGVRVLAHVERAVDLLLLPVFADRLRDGEDVGFGEGAVAAACRDGRWCRSSPFDCDRPDRAVRSAYSRSSAATSISRLLGAGLPARGERGTLCSFDALRRFAAFPRRWVVQGIGQPARGRGARARSRTRIPAIVRSLENLPELAMLMITLRDPGVRIGVQLARRRSGVST